MSCGIPLCGPSCAIPSCASAPVIGLGPCGVGSGVGSGIIGYGGRIYGGAVSSGSLGVLSGANVSCINQIPSSEIVIQPPAAVLTIPGPILSASCEPVSVGGYSPCAPGPRGYGLGSGSYLGGGLRGVVCAPRRKFSICTTPC